MHPLSQTDDTSSSKTCHHGPIILTWCQQVYCGGFFSDLYLHCISMVRSREAITLSHSSIFILLPAVLLSSEAPQINLQPPSVCSCVCWSIALWHCVLIGSLHSLPTLNTLPHWQPHTHTHTHDACQLGQTGQGLLPVGMLNNTKNLLSNLWEVIIFKSASEMSSSELQVP